jgi:hypothetical protein
MILKNGNIYFFSLIVACVVTSRGVVPVWCGEVPVW